MLRWISTLRFGLLPAAAGLFAATIPSTARATILKPLTVEQLAVRSERIVVGKVVARKSRWNRSATRIVTEVTVRITERLKEKNNRAKTVKFSRLGGRVGRLEMRVLGAPRFRQGDRVLVFLTRRNNRLYVTGMLQGRFRLRVDPASGKTIATRSLTYVRKNAKGPALKRRLTLNELRLRVKTALSPKRSTR